MLRSTLRGLLLGGAFSVMLPSLAGATPVTYYLTSGSVTLQATTGAETLLTTSGYLTGVQVTFDDAVPEVLDIVLTMAPVGPEVLSRHYDGFDTIEVHSATVSTAAGFDGTGVTVLNASVANYAYTVGPLNVFGTFSALNSGGPPPPAYVNAPFMAITPAASGVIEINQVTGNFSLLGVTIAEFPKAVNSSENFNLVVKADFVFRGAPAVPEPSSAALVGLGVLGLLAAGRRFLR